MNEEPPTAEAIRSRPADASRRFAREAVALLGLPFDTLSLVAVVERLREAAFAGTRCFVSTPNLNFVVAARADAAFRDSILRSALSLPDGAPIVWAARWLGLPIVERVAGASVFEALRAHGGPPLRVFFFGGPPGVAERACRRLNEAPCGLVGVGHDEAGFGSLDEMSSAARIDRINASGAHFVVVSLGARKGHAWIERNAPNLQAPLLCHLGAVVNFVAGEVSRAPAWMQRAGLEWAWRIREEPQLWHRYRTDGIAFLKLLAGSVLPLWWSDRRRASSAADAATFDAVRNGSRAVELRLGGTWTLRALGPLRSAFAEAVERGDRVSLRLSALAGFDAAFVGLLMLARGELGVEGLRLLDAAPAMQAALRRHGAGFLLAGAEPGDAR